MTLRDLYLVTDINTRVLITNGQVDYFQGQMGAIPNNIMSTIVVDISQHKGLIIIIVKEK